MTTPVPRLTRAAAADLVAAALVPRGPDRRSVGLEIEWLVVDAGDPVRHVGAPEVLAAAAGPLPAGGTVGVEPGGQLELTTRRHRDAATALDAADRDEQVLRDRLRVVGLALVATGLDTRRPPRRTLDLPRYRAMEAALDARGPEGRVMMCATASLQVNLDLGPDPLATWRRVGLLAPVLAAAFANSPTADGTGGILRSGRSAVWAALDPGRTAPVPTGSVVDWVAYALAADVLFVTTGDGCVPVPPGWSLGSWLEEGHPAGWPDTDDVAVHLSTLFPPVRPRGWIECRWFDALDAAGRRVAVDALTTLVDERIPEAAVREAVGDLDDPWPRVRHGTADPPLAAAAVRCLDLAADRLAPRRPTAASVVRSYAVGLTAVGLTAVGLAATVPPAPDLQSTVPIEQETP